MAEDIVATTIGRARRHERAGETASTSCAAAFAWLCASERRS